MTSLYISIEDYISDEEDQAIETLVETIIEEQYVYYSSKMNTY